MVAVAYPEKFVVERSAGTDRGWLPPLYIDDPFTFGAFGYPLWGSSLALYDFNPYFYSPYGYSFYNRYDPRFGYPGSVFIVEPGGGPGGGVQARPSGTARAVDGRGYTQVRPREPVQTEQAQGARRPASAGTSSGSSSPASSSSGGSASPAGASSGGSSDGGGRTAVPR
jgi:hypothetical protein